jgi:SMC interacting uncharacterized protein involved in chromosome segregation
MDSVTQQNAALVEEAAAASKAMEQQSSQLVTQIGYFDSQEMHRTAHAPVQPKVEAVRPMAAARRPVRPAATRVTSAKPSSAMPLARASGDDSSWQEF